MKGISSSLLRIIFAIIIGLVIILWPDAAINYLIITLGVLFLIPSLISVVGFLANRSKTEGASFPVEGIGSLLFGLFLVIIPGFFADILTIILGLIIMIGGIQQIATLVRARKWQRVPLAFYIIPTLIFIAGIVVVTDPRSARQTTLLIIGITALVYAIFELVNWIKFRKRAPLDGNNDYIEIK